MEDYMSKAMEVLDDIEKNGVSARGKSELVKHLHGERLTIRQMAIAKCYDCMGYYSDGRGTDCEIEECSLYPIMPYRKQGEKYVGKSGGKPMSEERKEKMRAVLRAARESRLAK
jgi:hypothetical protein